MSLLVNNYSPVQGLLAQANIITFLPKHCFQLSLAPGFEHDLVLFLKPCPQVTLQDSQLPQCVQPPSVNLKKKIP